MSFNIVYSPSTDPYFNLAAETQLLSHTKHNQAFLFLWQNANTVVIGKNQNPWKECNIKLLEEDHGRLARRTTGGGAVYHDLGNLNYSFAMPINLYDLERQLSVILRACRHFGIQAEFSGRNDIIIKDTLKTPNHQDANQAKFSGNAFLFNKTSGLQHGTLLVNSDFSKLGAYLSPSKKKIQAKGIDSVRSRVCNLCECSSTISIPALKDRLASEFDAEYGDAKLINLDNFLDENFLSLHDKHASWDWNFGHSPAFDIRLSERFAWGEIELCMTVKNAAITEAVMYTDSLLTNLSDLVCSAIVGSPFNATLCGNLLGVKPSYLMNNELNSHYIGALQDIANWLEQEIK